jgi:hypothetical protein
VADDAFGVAPRPLIGGSRAALGRNLAIPGHWQKADSWICFIPERNGQFDRPLAIETFVRVVDTGSLSVAARIQNIGQPAIFKAIDPVRARSNLRARIGSVNGLTAVDVEDVAGDE